MSAKPDVKALLQQKQSRPVIHRGTDLELGITQEENTQVQDNSAIAELQTPLDTEKKNSGIAEARKSARTEGKTKTGWEIRTDLVRAFKILAVEQGNRDYQVIEEAMTEYLERR